MTIEQFLDQWRNKPQNIQTVCEYCGKGIEAGRMHYPYCPNHDGIIAGCVDVPEITTVTDLHNHIELVKRMLA
jgi:hypothetical protein